MERLSKDAANLGPIKNKDEIAALEDTLGKVEKNLKNVTKYSIGYLKGLLEKFGKDFPRKTRFKSIEEIDRRAIETKEVKVGVDLASSFVGTKVPGAHISCTNFDKLAVFSKDGTYKVVAVPEKLYIDQLAWAGVADKKTVMNVVYKNKETGQAWAKRFIVDKFILEKIYRFVDEKGELVHISTDPNAAVELHFSAKAGKKPRSLTFHLKEVPIKNAQGRGIKIVADKVKKIVSV